MFSNLAPETYIRKETKWHLLCCCHGNTLRSSHFLPFKVAPNTPGSHIVLTLSIRLLGVDDPFLRYNLGILVLIKTDHCQSSWQRHDGSHFLSLVIYISGAKFEEQLFNISRDILDWVLHCFSGTTGTYDVIAFLICIIQKRTYL